MPAVTKGASLAVIIGLSILDLPQGSRSKLLLIAQCVPARNLFLFKKVFRAAAFREICLCCQ
jgi:hypothetical protein